MVVVDFRLWRSPVVGLRSPVVVVDMRLWRSSVIIVDLRLWRSPLVVWRSPVESSQLARATKLVVSGGGWRWWGGRWQ